MVTLLQHQSPSSSPANQAKANSRNSDSSNNNSKDSKPSAMSPQHNPSSNLSAPSKGDASPKLSKLAEASELPPENVETKLLVKGVCCGSEIPLVKKILGILDGVS
jgi:hypothetical protein